MRLILSLAVVVSFIGASQAHAVPITLFNTGVTAANNADGTNSNIQTIGGSADPHYSLLANPSGPILPTPALVVTDQGAYFRPGNSQYVNDQGSANGPSAAGNYDFRTTFDLTGLAPYSATVSGTIFVDNSIVNVYVNGVGTGISGGSFSNGSQVNFTIPTNFAGFGPGINTLDFIVNNAGFDPMALDVTLLRGTATPEPSSFILAGLGALGLFAVARRRRKV